MLNMGIYFEEDDWFADISKYKYLGESFIRKHANEVHWPTISEYQQLSESFIREFADKVDWRKISWYQKLSESFIIEFQDKVCWDSIASCQKVSDSFIKKYHDKLRNWELICRVGNLSESFFREFDDKIYILELLVNKHSYRFENLLFEKIESIQDKIKHFNEWWEIIIDYDLIHHSPEFIKMIHQLNKDYSVFKLDWKKIKIKKFQMRKCQWCPLTRRWINKRIFERFRHRLYFWRYNPKLAHVQKRLEREFEEYFEEFQSLKGKN